MCPLQQRLQCERSSELHQRVVSRFVDEAEDELLEIRATEANLYPRVCRLLAEDERTLARIEDEAPCVVVELQVLHIELDQVGIAAHPNQVHLARLAQVDDGRDRRRDADTACDCDDCGRHAGPRVRSAAGGRRGVGGGGGVSGGQVGRRRKGRREGAIEPTRADGRLGERRVNCLRPIADPGHAHA
eukprot:scaffold7613_cov59-Phaeocystis_antarctica.AAC.4